MKIIASIKDPPVIKRILTHLVKTKIFISKIPVFILEKKDLTANPAKVNSGLVSP
jgi:hypothetical protein